MVRIWENGKKTEIKEIDILNEDYKNEIVVLK